MRPPARGAPSLLTRDRVRRATLPRPPTPHSPRNDASTGGALARAADRPLPPSARRSCARPATADPSRKREAAPYVPHAPRPLPIDRDIPRTVPLPQTPISPFPHACTLRGRFQPL